MVHRPFRPNTWLVRKLAHLNHLVWWRRAMTLGVRAMVIDCGRVLLVRHTYVPGWHFPGGAVDAGESAQAAAVRELREEAGLVCTSRPVLLGFYRNRAHSRRDHVACYVISGFTTTPHRPDWEIAEAAFFPVDALPDGTTRATRARLAEYLEGVAIPEDW